MSALVFSLIAGGFSALSSLCFRKNTGNSLEKSSSGYLAIFYFFSFLLSLFLYPKIWNAQINYIILAVGVCVGLLSSTMMLFTYFALKKGPAGLTFAFQNASAVFPGLILFMLFGPNFGFSCSLIQLTGMILVIYGLFVGAMKEKPDASTLSSKWLKYALACFIVQILALTFIQGRCILFDCNGTGFISNFTFTEADDVWFMPGQFGASFAMQAIIYLREKNKLRLSEVFYGCTAGTANFLSTALLLLATKSALPFEKGILFPCFAVSSMILCNVWANRLYSEKFNLKTNALCSVGIFMGVSG